MSGIRMNFEDRLLEVKHEYRAACKHEWLPLHPSETWMRDPKLTCGKCGYQSYC